jgi:hypothetical protein
MLCCEKMLYIYDLSTLETYKRKGYAWILLNYDYAVAKEHNCKSLQLDSGMEELPLINWISRKILRLAPFILINLYEAYPIYNH